MGNGPVCVAENPVCVDEGTLAVTATPEPGPVCDANWWAAQAVHDMETEGLGFGARFIQDAEVRANYQSGIRKMSQDILQRIKSGKTSPLDGAREANALRNEIMEAGRVGNSDLGLAISQRLKETGKTLATLQEEKAMSKFGRAFKDLAEGEQNEVFLAIVVSSGVSRGWITRAMPWVGRAGKALIVVTVAIAVYHVYTAQDKVEATAREVGVASGGILAGVGGGALMGLACGPASPVCVGIGVFVGGALGAFGMDLTFDWIKRH